MGPSITEETEYKPPETMTYLALTFTFEQATELFSEFLKKKQRLWSTSLSKKKISRPVNEWYNFTNDLQRQ